LLGRTAEGGCPYIDQLRKQCAAWLQFILQSQHGPCDLQSARPRQAHHANPSAPRRSRDRDNGVIQIHEPIVAGKLEATNEREISQWD
jgi:hypothetical protein